MVEEPGTSLSLEKHHAELYALLVRQLRQAAVFLLDTSGHITTWNPGVEQLFGYKESEWIGQTADIIFTPEDRAVGEASKEMQTAAAAGEAADVRWHVRKDQTRIFVDGVMQALRDSTGTLVGFAKVTKDATERQVAQEMLYAILESISDAFYAVDSEFRFTYVNCKAEELWRRSRKELAGRHYWTEFPQAVDSESYRMHLKAMAERKSVHFETVSPILGRWVEVSVYPDDRGGLSCYFRDIDDRKRNEERLRQLTEGLNQSQVMIRALDGTIIFWSAGCTRLYGYAAEQAVGRRSHELLQTEFPEPLADIEAQLLATGTWQGELRHVLHDGSPVICASHWILHRGVEGDNKTVIEANMDITEQKTIQQQLRRANEELTHFSHIVSHDLQAPVRMVRSYGELLSRRYSSTLDESGAEFLRFILEGAEGMQALIRTLLSYAQTAEQPVKRQPVRVDALVSAVLVALQPAIEDTAAEIICGDLPTVDADPVQLQQVLQNLIGNALKYGKPQSHPHIEIKVESRPHDWLFAIQDNGIGIDPRYLERIFEPLKRLHGSEIAGTGIGLAVCKKIVERHGGRIWAESQPGQGSTFLFTLPRYQQPRQT